MRPLTIVLLALAASCGPSPQELKMLGNPNPEVVPGILATNGPTTEFARNGIAATEKYVGKVVTVRGVVISVEPYFGMIRVELGEKAGGSAYTAAMFGKTPESQEWAKTIAAGDSIRVRGMVLNLGEYSVELRNCTAVP